MGYRPYNRVSNWKQEELQIVWTGLLSTVAFQQEI
jgi:hypothetical protein